MPNDPEPTEEEKKLLAVVRDYYDVTDPVPSGLADKAAEQLPKSQGNGNDSSSSGGSSN